MYLCLESPGHVWQVLNTSMQRSVSDVRCPNLQPLVDGLSCSELSRLKALELLGGDGLWDFKLWGGEGHLSQEHKRKKKALGEENALW